MCARGKGWRAAQNRRLVPDAAAHSPAMPELPVSLSNGSDCSHAAPGTGTASAQRVARGGRAGRPAHSGASSAAALGPHCAEGAALALPVGHPTGNAAQDFTVLC